MSLTWQITSCTLIIRAWIFPLLIKIWIYRHLIISRRIRVKLSSHRTQTAKDKTTKLARFHPLKEFKNRRNLMFPARNSPIWSANSAMSKCQNYNSLNNWKSTITIKHSSTTPAWANTSNYSSSHITNHSSNNWTT